jgi:MFS family permease
MTRFTTPRRAVSAMFILNGGLLGIWASRIPAIAEKHALTPNLLGLLLLCLAAGAIISFPLAGRVCDRFGAARVTRLIGVAYVIALVTLGIAPSLPLLALSLFGFGVAHGAMDVTMNVWATEVEKAADRALMASFHAMFSLGAGLGAGLGYFAILHGVSVPMHFASAGLSLAAVTLAFAATPWTSAQNIAHKASLFTFPKGALALVGLIALAAAMGEGAVADWAAVYLNGTLGLSQAQATLGYSTFSAAIFTARMLADRAINRFGPPAIARASGIAATLGIIVATTAMGLPQALIGFAMMGAGYATLFPLAFSRAAADPDISPGRAIASVATLGYGGLLAGPPLIGFLAEATSLRLALASLAAFAILIVAFAPHLRVPRS